MKKRIFAALLAVLMLIPCMLTIVSASDDVKIVSEPVSTTSSSKLQRIMEMEYIANSEDGNIELYCNKKTAEFGVRNLKTGEIYLSNPISFPKDQAEEDTYDQEFLKTFFSHVTLNFMYNSNNGMSTYYSYTDSLTYGQVEVKETARGIVVKYVLGDSRKQILLPLKISVEDFENLIKDMPAAYKSQMETAFSKYDPYEKNEDGSPKHNQTKIDKWISDYPICATIPIYVIKQEYLQNDANDARKSELASYVEKYTDYTFEQLTADYEKVKEENDGDKFALSIKPTFELEVNYYVDNEGLIVDFDASSLKYDKELYFPTSITILPYFNAAERKGTGFTFVPDGSGALIRFEDIGETEIINFDGALYGPDYALYQTSIVRNAEQYTMPVYGFIDSTNGTPYGYFAIIEDGDSLATITSYHNSYYHTAYASFRLFETDEFYLADSFSSGSSSSSAVVKVEAEQTYTGKVKTKFVFLSDSEGSTSESADYMGMARYYRNYLLEKGDLEKLTSSDIIPEYTRLFIEVFGSIKVDDTFLTFPVKKDKELTTFQNVIDIHKELAGQGVGNTTFILKGFANGGLDSTYPTKIKWQKNLGGASGLKALLEYANAEDTVGEIEVAPDVDFTYSQGIKKFSGFSYKKNGVRTLDNRYSTKRLYNASTQMFERAGGVAISSASFITAYNKMYESISDYELSSFAVRTLGSDLNSDFDLEDFNDREKSKDNVVELLKLLSKGDEATNKKAYNLIIDAGNQYAVPYADAILSASLDSSRFIMTDEAVPFFGIVYHGSVEFAGNAINMDGDSDYMFLKALENGASLYFTLAYDNAEVLKFDKEYNKYYSLDYETLKDDIVRLYKEYNELMKNKQDKFIVKHEFVNVENGYYVERVEKNSKGESVIVDNTNVVMVLYENEKCTVGDGFILNYNPYAIKVVIGERVIPINAFSYAQYSE